MKHEAAPYRAIDLAAVADDWGYRSDIRERSNDPGSDDVLLRGGIVASQLSCGLRVCQSDLVAARAHERSAILPRSFSVVFPMAQDDDAFRVKGKKAVPLALGNCVLIRAANDVELAGSYRCGQHICGLWLDLIPEKVTDPELAEWLCHLLRSDSISIGGIGSTMQILLERMRCCNVTGIVGRLRLESCALDLLAAILDQEGRKHHDCARICPRDAACVGRVRDYLIAQPEHDHSLNELAVLAGVSVTSLKRKFMGVYGQSVFDFLRDIRLDRARHGLEREGWTIKQAAWFAGYRHPTNFGAAYRRRYGVTPAQREPSAANRH